MQPQKFLAKRLSHIFPPRGREKNLQLQRIQVVGLLRNSTAYILKRLIVVPERKESH